MNDGEYRGDHLHVKKRKHTHTHTKDGDKRAFAHLGLNDALVLSAGVAMIECMRVIIGEVGTREREKERGSEGR